MLPSAKMVARPGWLRANSIRVSIGLAPQTPQVEQQPDPTFEQHTPWSAAQPLSEVIAATTHFSIERSEMMASCTAAGEVYARAPASSSAPADPALASRLTAAKTSAVSKSRKWEKVDFIL